MAILVNGKRFCKVLHHENGRTTTRRIHTMMVQASDGRVHFLEGAALPDSITLHTGVPYHGAHLAEVLLSPKGAKGELLLPNAKPVLKKRDALFLVFGMFGFWLVATLAEGVAQSLSH